MLNMILFDVCPLVCVVCTRFQGKWHLAYSNAPVQPLGPRLETPELFQEVNPDEGKKVGSESLGSLLLFFSSLLGYPRPRGQARRAQWGGRSARYRP